MNASPRTLAGCGLLRVAIVREEGEVIQIGRGNPALEKTASTGFDRSWSVIDHAALS